MLRQSPTSLCLLTPLLFSFTMAQGQNLDPLVIPDAGIYWRNEQILYVQPNGELKVYDGKATKTLKTQVKKIYYQKPDLYVVDRQGVHFNQQTLPLHKEAQIQQLRQVKNSLVLYYTYGACKKVMVFDAQKITQVKWIKDTCQGFSQFWNVYISPTRVSFVKNGASTTRQDFELRTGRFLCDTHTAGDQCEGADEPFFDVPTNCEDHSRDDDLPWVKALQKEILPPDALSRAYQCGPWQVAVRLLNAETDGPQQPRQWKIHFYLVQSHK